MRVRWGGEGGEGEKGQVRQVIAERTLSVGSGSRDEMQRVQGLGAE